MSPVKRFFVTLSILTSLGGAVNSGWSYFGIAIPFMIYLLIISYRFKKSFFVGTLIFVVLCIITSLTRDKNPLIYPIIRDGEVTVLRDGYHVGFNDGSGRFKTEEDIKYIISSTDEAGTKKLNEFIRSSDQKSVEIFDKNAFYEGSKITLTKLKKDEKIDVIGIKHSYADLHSSIAIVTPIGRFGGYNDMPFGPNKSDTEMKPFLKTNKPVQSMPLSALSVFPLLLMVNPLIFFLVFGITYLILTLSVLVVKNLSEKFQESQVNNSGAEATGQVNLAQGGQDEGTTEAPKDAETEPAPESKVEEEKK